MSLTQLFPVIRALPRGDKLQLLQFLASELARDEGVEGICADGEYAVWSPFDAYEAAQVLEQHLDEKTADE